MDDSVSEAASEEEGSVKSNSNSASSESLKRLASKIHCKLCVGLGEVLAVKEHRSAACAMTKLRQSLEQTSLPVCREVRLLLLYTGVSVHRRILLGKDETEINDLRTTLALLFALQLMCDSSVPPPPDPDSSPSFQVVSDEEEECENPRHEGRKRPREEDASDADPSAAPVRKRSSAEHIVEVWLKESLVNMVKETESRSPDAVCRACVQICQSRAGGATMSMLTEISELFFRCSAQTLFYGMLSSQEAEEDAPACFLTLGALDFLAMANDQKEERLAAIVDAAESEAGQQVRMHSLF
tara:strand:+ start:72 stop:965 length:894 start_codon:yes stop_codon:yes gene_type:complete